MISQRLNWLEKVADILPVLGIVMAAIATVLLLGILIRRILNMRWLLKRGIVTLELTPPASASKSPLSQRSSS